MPSEGWHGPGGFRPPWWPEGESWPPSGQMGWQFRRRFMRRVAVFFFAFLLLLVGVSALVVAIVSSAVGSGHRGELVALTVLGLFVVFGTFGRLIRRMAAPLGDVIEAAGRVAEGDYSVRVAARGPREVRALGRSFNSMAERLEATEAERRNLLADLAHELRTPLSIVRGNVEGMLDGLYPLDAEHLSPIVEETKVLDRLLGDLQTLSSAEVGALRLHREPVDPAGLVEEVVAAFDGESSSNSVSLDARVGSDLGTLEADPIRLNEVLANLVSNALRHTPRGGSIVVSADRAGSGIAFVVADTGAGIAEDELPHVFDRFAKSAESRGTGLGLPIAKAIVEAHSGTIEIESEPGKGTTVRLVVPVSV